MECYGYLRNVQDLPSDGNVWFDDGISFYFLKDQSRRHQFSEKVLPGMFQGSALYAGGIWKGDNLVADIVELEMWTRQTSTPGDSVQRNTPNNGENFIFPCADGTVKLSGGDQVFPKIHLNAGSTPERRRAQWWSSRKFERISIIGRNGG